MHFVLNEEDRVHSYHLFNNIKREMNLECVNKFDLLGVLQYILGYKNWNEVEVLQNQN